MVSHPFIHDPRSQPGATTPLTSSPHCLIHVDPYSVYGSCLDDTGEFYGINPVTANLELVARFFEKYPDYADKAFLSVKGGGKENRLEPDAS